MYRCHLSDAAGADDSDGLVLQQVADEERREPALVPARAHELVRLHHAPRRRQRQRRAGLCTVPYIIFVINMLMPAPMIVLHIQGSYWYSKHRGIGPNLASVADGQSCPSLG